MLPPVPILPGRSVFLAFLSRVRRNPGRDASYPVFTARRHTSAVYPVRVSVCLSKVGVLLKQLNVGSPKQRHTIWPMNSSFLMPKISAKPKRGRSQRRRQMHVGRLLGV